MGRLKRICRKLLDLSTFLTRRSLCRIGPTNSTSSHDRLRINCFIPGSQLRRFGPRRFIGSPIANRGPQLRPHNGFLFQLTKHSHAGDTDCCAPGSLARYLIGCTLGRLLGSGATSRVLALAIYRPTVNDTTFLGRIVSRLTTTCLRHGRRRLKRHVPRSHVALRARGIGVQLTSHGICNVSGGPVTVRLTRISL